MCLKIIPASQKDDVTIINKSVFVFFRAGDNNSTILEVQVDVPNECAKYYTTESGSEVTEVPQRSGSPTSSRSVNFAGEETLRPNRYAQYSP